MSETNDQPEISESPAGLSRRHLLMGTAMLAVAGAAYARMPKRRFQNMTNAKFEAMFPKAFGKWTTLPSSELIMPPEGDLTAKLYQHILTRTYVNGLGDSVMFLVAYNSAQVNNVQVHRPEICYAASGFDIKGNKPVDVQLGDGKAIPARLVRAERVTRTENIIYWTRIGDDFPQSWTAQRIAMTKANLEGFYADGLLVRASSVDNDEAKSVALVSTFLKELVQHSEPEGRYLAFRV